MQEPQQQAKRASQEDQLCVVWSTETKGFTKKKVEKEFFTALFTLRLGSPWNLKVASLVHSIGFLLAEINDLYKSAVFCD